MPIDAMREDFEEVEFFGKPALFSNSRIARDTVPKGLHKYEIRHTDDDWGEPCQLAYGILVNHYGTLITNEAIQLGPDGRLDFDSKALNYTDGDCRSVAEYIEQYPPVQKTVFDIIPLESEKTDWLYSDSEKDKERGVIGHLRGDFGSGKEFWTTWWPHQDKLKSQPFKTELDDVINWLRQDFGPLKDMNSMAAYCSLREKDAKVKSTIPAYGFKIETPDCQYYLRCNPTHGDYNFYVYCCDRAAQREQNHEAPTQAKKSVIAQLNAKATEVPSVKRTSIKKNEMEI